MNRRTLCYSLLLITLALQACTNGQTTAGGAQAEASNLAAPVKKGNKWQFNEQITFELRSLENSITNFNDLRKKASSSEPYQAFAEILIAHTQKLELQLATGSGPDEELLKEVNTLKNFATELSRDTTDQSKVEFTKIKNWMQQLHTRFAFDYN